MESNNPTMPVMPVQAAPNPAAPNEPQVTMDPMNSSTGGSSKKILILVVVLLVVALAIGAFYFYMNNPLKSANKPASSSVTATNTLDSLDADLQKVDATSSDDLSSIDQDLKNL